MFILINGYKDSYDRPINMNINEKSENKSELILSLKGTIVSTICWKLKLTKEQVNDALDNHEEYFGDGVSVRYDCCGQPVYFTIGCPSDNEYDGETYQIFEV